jgi:phosphoglycolate phosphatase
LKEKASNRVVEMDLLIFDLDGTLIDSKLDLAHAVNATRTFMGLPVLEHDRVYSYVGNGAPVLIRRAMGPGLPEAEFEKALTFFLAYYNDHMLDCTSLYPGVRESLASFKAAGKSLAVLTNKPVRMSTAIIDGLGLGDHFFRIYGGNSFDQKKPHPIGIERLMSEAGATHERTLMIGDSAVDVRTARNARVSSCGVTWGFQPDTLRDEPPDVVFDRMEELTRYVLSSN